MIKNALTIDVEDYFQVSAFSPYIGYKNWENCECHIEKNINRILEILSNKGIKATFFTLGWIAERYPLLIRLIVREGHELASHGYSHNRVTDQSPAEFLNDIRRSKLLLESFSDKEIAGYRAPSFSIRKSNWWAFDCLLEAGYRYSSSIYPIQHDHYGMVDSPRIPFDTGQGLIELPMSTFRILKKNIPASGGGYFRLFPYILSKWMLQQINNKNQPGIFYFHPWELDVNQPIVLGIDKLTKFRHYLNISFMENRLLKLFDDFEWGRVDQVFSKSFK